MLVIMDPKNSADEPTSDYQLPSRDSGVVQPLHDNLTPVTPLGTANAAADLIRSKLNNLYVDEPKAKEEIAEAEVVKHRTKHQQFMYDLSHSGKSLAEIQTAWHAYYVALPNDEKHAVWQEFYAAHNQIEQTKRSQPTEQSEKAPEPHSATRKSSRKSDIRSVKDIKDELLGTVRTRQKLSQNHHLRSMLFGLGMGVLTILVLLFSFFNERFIAPFITPSRSVSSTPIIIDPGSTVVGKDTKIIIPKINVEIPIVYDVPTINEAEVEKGLERGVVHYATTPNPGEIGNGVIFGHSANNILNHGKYKFAFVLLKRLEAGDTFYIQKDGKQYAYKVFDKKIVPPTDVSVLYPQWSDKPATFTLITCDPPGTSLNRLVVSAEQISPDPKLNTASTAKQSSEQPKILASNSPSLWSRIKSWF